MKTDIPTRRRAYATVAVMMFMAVSLCPIFDSTIEADTPGTEDWICTITVDNTTGGLTTKYAKGSSALSDTAPVTFSGATSGSVWEYDRIQDTGRSTRSMRRSTPPLERWSAISTRTI